MQLEKSFELFGETCYAVIKPANWEHGICILIEIHDEKGARHSTKVLCSRSRSSDYKRVRSLPMESLLKEGWEIFKSNKIDDDLKKIFESKGTLLLPWTESGD